jgi:HK97 gp10 family phage protein
MASMNVSGLDELMRKMEKLSNRRNVEEIAKKAVEAAQPLNEASMRSALASVEHGPYATGSVSGSISSTPAKINAYGAYAVARPTGHDAKGVRNGAKAAFLQYGTSKLPARPWRERAVSGAEAACVKTMEEVIKSEMELG